MRKVSVTQTILPSDDGLTRYNLCSILMKLGGFLLLLSGWGIVVAALSLLHGHAVSGFIIAGLCVEILGLVFVMRAHLPASEDNG